MSRQPTHFYVDSDYVPRSVDNRGLDQARRAQVASVAFDHGPEGGDSGDEGLDDEAYASVERRLSGTDTRDMELTARELNKLFTTGRRSGKALGMIGESDMFLSPEHNPSTLAGREMQLDQQALFKSDTHQLTLLLLSFFHPPAKPEARGLSLWKKAVNKILDHRSSLADARSAMVSFLNGGAGANNKFSQPAALSRLAEHMVDVLHPAGPHPTIDKALSSTFCATPVHSPDNERLLTDTGGGLPMTILVDALPDDAGWMIKAADSLRRAELAEEGLNKLRQNPRTARLMDEPGKGVGFKGIGRWEQGSFGCWYVGRHAQYGDGRYAVALQDTSGCYCDAESCRALSLDWLIKHGQGAFINGNESSCACNMELCKNEAILHNDLVWIPMRVKVTFEDDFGVWKYRHLAVKGGSRDK